MSKSLARSDSSVQPQAHDQSKPRLLIADDEPVVRVLIAEDNEINQITARRVLQKLGFEVDIADNGRVAIEMTASNKYAAVLMDCQMPEVAPLAGADGCGSCIAVVELADALALTQTALEEAAAA